MFDTDKDTRQVKLTITSCHFIVPMKHFGKSASMFSDVEEYSSFNDYFDIEEDDEEVTPDDIPEELVDALDEILSFKGKRGLEPEANMEEFSKMCGDFRKMVEKYDKPSGDTYEFCVVASMSRKLSEDGNERIEISYRNEELADGAITVIAYEPAKPGAISIINDGSVMSSLVCELGVRNISAYTTPYMTFEAAVYAKRCDGGFSFEHGGTMELDYIVELRGADIQRTVMTIKADVI